MPPLDGLFHGDFTVAVAYENERWRFDLFDEMHRIAFGVNGGIVVDRSTEKRNHPLVEVVDAVVAQPI